MERGLSHHTGLAYGSDVADFLRWRGNKDPLRSSPADLDDYLAVLRDERGLAPRSVFRKMEALRAFFRFQASEGRIESDPTEDFRSPRLPSKLPDSLSTDEIEKVLAVPSKGRFHVARARCEAELFYASGIRESELIGLEPAYLDLEEGFIRVFGKGSKERMVPIHEKACDTLKRWLRLREERFQGKTTAAKVFLNREGKELSRTQVWRDMRLIGKEAGLSRPLHPHLLRHTFATHLIQNGADARSLQEMLGHASLQTTQIYTHLDASALKQTHRKTHPRG